MLGEPANASGVGVLRNAGTIEFSGDAGNMEGIILTSSTTRGPPSPVGKV